MDSIEAPLRKGEIVWAAGSPYIWRPYRMALDNLNNSRRIEYGRALEEMGMNREIEED